MMIGEEDDDKGDSVMLRDDSLRAFGLKVSRRKRFRCRNPSSMVRRESYVDSSRSPPLAEFKVLVELFAKGRSLIDRFANMISSYSSGMEEQELSSTIMICIGSLPAN